MAKTATATAKPVARARRRRKDATGRVDVLASRVIGELVRISPNPVLKAVHTAVKPELDRVLATYLGPHNKHMRVLRQIVRDSAKPKEARA
jgi:hypothetical protein